MRGDLASIVEERHGLMNKIQKLLNELAFCHGIVNFKIVFILFIFVLEREKFFADTIAEKDEQVTNLQLEIRKLEAENDKVFFRFFETLF